MDDDKTARGINDEWVMIDRMAASDTTIVEPAVDRVALTVAWVSRVVVVLVFLAGLVFVVWPSVLVGASTPQRTTTTTNSSTTIPATSTTEHSVAKGDGKTTTTDTTNTSPGNKLTGREVVTTDRQLSVFEKSWTDGHLGPFVLLGIVAMVAFLVGALIQGVGRGEFVARLGSPTSATNVRRGRQVERGLPSGDEPASDS